MKKKLVTGLLLVVIMAEGLMGCGGADPNLFEEAVDAYTADEPTVDYAPEAGSGGNAWAENSYAEEAITESAYPSDDSGAFFDSTNGNYLESAYDDDLSRVAEDYYSDYDTDIYDGSVIGDDAIYIGAPDHAEEYSELTETGFSSAAREPLSTFAADVDTASYANLRRLIREGYSLDQLPDDSVRIEELLNYFAYDYNLPSPNEPFGVTTQIAACPWNPGAELLLIGLKTQDIDYTQAPASNLVFLLDVSGSMDEPDKLPLLKESFALLTANLSDKDRVSIVTYAGSDSIVLDGVSGHREQTIIDALDNLTAGGGTNGSRGITTAYELAEEYFIEGGNNRVILATDGDLNLGLTSEEELGDLITAKRETGVFLSVLGFGTGNIKDNNMELLADKGNGNYAYIDTTREAQKVLVEEMGATLLTICKDVKIQVDFNSEVVSGYRLLGYENRRMDWQDFQDDTKDAGEIGAGHSVTALYEIILEQPVVALTQSQNSIYGNIPANNRAYFDEWLTINIRYKKPAGNTSALQSYPVDYESYSADPGRDWQFAAAVAEFGLLASRSNNQGRASLDHVRSVLEDLDAADPYRVEFYNLVSQISVSLE
ncbi:MAG: VWA domain-containing protein [Lachnospiraceae bacterium]|nr:VWA domain-containing protein [Lachnospiraceae bacterium]